MSASKLISTHIRGAGHALFQIRDHRLELRSRSTEEMPVDGSWINKTGLVAEGLPLQPYIHLDIRTPFGESVGKRQVEEALAESLGPRRDRFSAGGWHIQFVEDTNLGSNHRVFVDLIETGNDSKGLAGMDAGLSLELAMEALGELVSAEKSEANFQLLYGGEGFCYSLLYLNGAAFHVLRVGEGAGAKSSARLRRHREFASVAGKNGGPGMKTYLAKGDPLWEFQAIRELHPEEFTCAGSGLPSKESAKSGDRADGIASLLHLGLAQAALQRDFSAHNRVPEADRRRNAVIRTRHRFTLATGATFFGCLAVAGAMYAAIHATQSRLSDLKEKAAAYQPQVEAIRALRVEKASLERGLEGLRPLWKGPLDWGAIFAGIAAALPEEAGMDGLAVARKPDGVLELSFRAWVKDWDKVQTIQKRLSTTRPFKSVTLSEQRKDLATGNVVFHVTAGLERN